MFDAIRKLCLDDSGATALEYGLIAALVSAAAVAALIQLGDALSGLYTSVSEQMNSATPSSP